MIATETLDVPNELDGDRRFVVGTLSWPEELMALWGLLKNYAESSRALHLRHGFAFRARLPGPALVLAHPRHLHRVLRSHVLNYPKSRDYEYLRPILGNGIFVSDGDLWTRQRRLLQPEFRPQVVGRFLPVLVDSVEALFAEWDRGAGEARDVSDDLMRLTLWGVGGALFNSDFRAEAGRIGRALELCLKQGTLQMMSMGLLQPWMPTPGNRAAKAAQRDLDAIVRAVITRKRADSTDTDMLSRLLAAKDPDTGVGMSDPQALDEVKSLILAGHETTSLTLSWTFYLLAQHPEVEDRLRDEVRRVLGGRRPTVEDVPKLEYTRMVLSETMRLYPPVPGVSRTAREADSFDGVDVAAGESIVLSMYTTHRHPELWADPERFDPERFAPSRVGAVVPYSYLPFLLGRRVCIGEHFAVLEGVLALAMIVDQYRLERVDAAPIGTHPVSTLRLARPLRMRVRRREAPRS